MDNRNLIDISNLPQKYRLLALDFLEFLNHKSQQADPNTGNYDRTKLLAAFKKARDKGIFDNINDSVSWQREIRDEWE